MAAVVRGKLLATARAHAGRRCPEPTSAVGRWDHASASLSNGTRGRWASARVATPVESFTTASSPDAGAVKAPTASMRRPRPSPVKFGETVMGILLEVEGYLTPAAVVSAG